MLAGESPEFIRIMKLFTPDGRFWIYKAGSYWTNAKGEVRRFRPEADPHGWHSDYFQVWESDDGELTQEWPSRRRLPPAAAAGQAVLKTRIDPYFNTWTREASGEWVDEYGGRTNDRLESLTELRTADGKAWRKEFEKMWVSRGGECQRQRPDAGTEKAGAWRERFVLVWVSSDGDLCLGWPSRVLMEQQRGAARAASGGAAGGSSSAAAAGGAVLRCADEADALAALRQRRGRAGPDANARAVDALLREALLRQAERVAVERRGGGAPDALLLTREDLLGPRERGGA